jgi:NDP-sugar pyrophosphorylase family protein
MRDLTVVMPMAGFGNRFREVGYLLPKPLIEVNNQPMFLEALSSLAGYDQKSIDYVFILRQGDPYLDDIAAVIKSHVENSQIICLPEPTRGAAETVFFSRSSVNPDSQLLIVDCDMKFSSKDLENLIANSEDYSCDAALITFESSSVNYSYALASDGFVTETAEKIAISFNAIIGAYYFSSASDFFDSCERFLSTDLDFKVKEYFVSGVYNFAIAQGLRIRMLNGTMQSFGTPEDRDDYIRSLP